MIPITTTQVYLQHKILKLNRNNYHFMQDCKPQTQFYWKLQETQQTPLLTQTTFLTLNSDFKFIIISTINKSIKLLAIQGRLVYNNGSTVAINIGHQSFVHHYLNTKFDSSQKKTIFAIDQSSQTLIFTAKMNNVVEVQYANKFIKLCQEEVLLRKKSIVSLIAIVGLPIDGENALMRKIMIQKKKLKNKMQEVLKSPYNQENMIEEQKQNEDEGGVIYYGQGTDFILEELMQNEGESKKVQGGYFTIEQSNCVIKNKKTNEYVSKKLVVKTLKEKRRAQDLINHDRSNSIKMKKQLQIIDKIDNKKYLIRYYCDIKDKENMTKVYMDHYDYSLQEYVHYLGDSIQYLDKVNITKQIVDAVLSLHQSFVVHRDIKPANFLVDDSNHHSKAFKIKIIDFAESYCKNIAEYNIDYGCSHPYSPIQCIDKKGFNQKGPMQGIGNKEIDYWSVGITIYEIFFRKLPVSFSRAFLVDITSSWKTELLVAVNQRQKIGLNVVDDIINIICVKMMKFSQNQRMNLQLTKRILESLESYIKNLLQILEEI